LPNASATLLLAACTIYSVLDGFVGITRVQLDEDLRSQGRVGHSQVYVDVARQLDINPFYIAAHAAWDTGWGTSRIFRDKNNAFGYGAFDRCPSDCALSFDSVQDGGVFAMGRVNANYLTPGGKFYNRSTLAGMNVRYATDQNWKYGIAGIMNSLLDNVAEQQGST
jgi:beta-N-acetylglucosaminidase